jgi:hypothetical protein
MFGSFAAVGIIRGYASSALGVSMNTVTTLHIDSIGALTLAYIIDRNTNAKSYLVETVIV